MKWRKSVYIDGEQVIQSSLCLEAYLSNDHHNTCPRKSGSCSGEKRPPGAQIVPKLHIDNNYILKKLGWSLIYFSPPKQPTSSLTCDLAFKRGIFCMCQGPHKPPGPQGNNQYKVKNENQRHQFTDTGLKLLESDLRVYFSDRFKHSKTLAESFHVTTITTTLWALLYGNSLEN